MSDRALVVGLGVSGEAFIHHWRQRGGQVIVIDDRPDEAVRERARHLGVTLVEAPGGAQVDELVSQVDVVVPSPGVPERHPALAAASAGGVDIRSELELSSRWTRRPFIAVTGTNGKTTVTELTTAMLNAAGHRALAAGNIGLALSDAVRRDVDVLVVEASSFQLRFTDTFRPAVGVWLNLAPDHLDWHGDVDSYAAAKARLWAHQGPQDLAVANADDPVVWRHAQSAPGRVTGFGLSGLADFTVVDQGDGPVLAGPDGGVVPVAELSRRHPQDLLNALAAMAAAAAWEVEPEVMAQTLRTWRPPPHRLALAATVEGVDYYDDSKATNPHAALAAIAGFDSVVLIAGGRNKGLDLSDLIPAGPRLRAVVAMGEAAAEIVDALEGSTVVRAVPGMVEAVAMARTLARPGDVVLLSPACASFDQYSSYVQRGEHFTELVQLLATRVARQDARSEGEDQP